MPKSTIREAIIEDASLILEFIRELAIYERAEDEVLATVENIQSALFSQNPSVKAILCNTCTKVLPSRGFERKFILADHVEVTGAQLKNGLLTIQLVREIPEAMKPRTIEINGETDLIDHDTKAA